MLILLQSADSTWLYQQSVAVIIIVLGIIGFFRYILPRFERQQERNDLAQRAMQEKYEASLKEQIDEARKARVQDTEEARRARAQDTERFTNTINTVLTDNTNALRDVAAVVDKLATERHTKKPDVR